jgi:DNA-binding YbaB/EbfC family protein
MGKGMRAGRKSKKKAPNIQQQLKQAQALQREMEEAQAALEEQDFEASAGGGVVSAVVSGKKELKSIEIDPDVANPEDIDMLQDLIIACVNEAMRKVDEAQEAGMSSLTGGLDIPGLI